MIFGEKVYAVQIVLRNAVCLAYHPDEQCAELADGLACVYHRTARNRVLCDVHPAIEIIPDVFALLFRPQILHRHTNCLYGDSLHSRLVGGVLKPNIEIIRGMPLAIEGETKAERVVFRDRTLDVDGVFMLKQAIAPSVLLNGLETAEGHIVIDRQCRTNIPGCLAAGDCTGRPYQYAKAVGEGNVAAHTAAETVKKARSAN